MLLERVGEVEDAEAGDESRESSADENPKVVHGSILDEFTRNLCILIECIDCAHAMISVHDDQIIPMPHHKYRRKRVSVSDFFDIFLVHNSGMVY